MEKPQDSRSTPEIDWLALARTAHYRASELAHLLGISLRQLERCFLEDCAISPHDWLDCVRLWSAAQLLTQGRKPKEIFDDLGFSESRFFKRFRQYFGCTPRDYFRTQLRGMAADRVRLLKLFPGDELPAGWKNQAEAAVALEILRRKVRRSRQLLAYYRQADVAKRQEMS